MGRLIYSVITSLDGYVADQSGSFDWAAPDGQTHAFVNELERPIGIHLYGRRMYEVMATWETLQSDHAEAQDYARIWQVANKVVYSRTLNAVSTTKTRLEHDFDPDAVQQMKAESSSDISIGGADLAGQALRAGLIDECQLFVVPVIVGGGTSWLPQNVRLDLQLLDEHRFASGVVYLSYRTTTEAR